MVTVPGVWPVAWPEVSMEAMPGSELVQVAVLVTEVEPLVKYPVAVNCFVAPAITLGVAGLTVIDSS